MKYKYRNIYILEISNHLCMICICYLFMKTIQIFKSFDVPFFKLEENPVDENNYQISRNLSLNTN